MGPEQPQSPEEFQMGLFISELIGVKPLNLCLLKTFVPNFRSVFPLIWTYRYRKGLDVVPKSRKRETISRMGFISKDVAAFFPKLFEAEQKPEQ